MQVSKFMTSNPVTISPDKKVKDAATLMLEKKISVLPVVDEKHHLVGLITQSDFIGKEANVPGALASIKELFGQNFYFADVEDLYEQAKEKELHDVMTKSIRTLPSTSSLNDLVQLMIKYRLKRVPIVDDNKLMGMITRRDIMKAFAS